MSNDFRWLDDDDDRFANNREEQSGDESSPAAILRRQQDRPVEELDSRLQALRARALSADDTEADSAPPQALYDVDEALVRPEIVHKPGGVISAAALSAAQSKQVELLKDIVGGSLEAADDAPPRTLLSALVLPRLLTGLILFLAVALPFASPHFDVSDLPPPTFDADHPAGDRVFALIDGLAEGDRVLVGYEYGPTAAGELDPLADVLLRHLFARGAQPIIVTSNPIAVVHAQNVLKDIARSVQPAGLRLEANRDYYLLRYLVGGALGLRDLSQNFNSIAKVSAKGRLTGLDLTSLDEMALMLLIAERADDIRHWAEQVAPTTNVKLAAATGYAAQPLAEPYIRQTDGIVGLLVGIGDAYTYGEMLQDPPPPEPPLTSTPPPNATPQPTAAAAPNPAAYIQLRDRRQEASRLDAMTLGTVAAALIILFGNVYFGLRTWLRRRPASKNR